MNGDGRITVADARLALRAAARLERLSDARYSAATGRSIDYKRVDIGNKKVDREYGKYPKIADARKILRVAARIESVR